MRQVWATRSKLPSTSLPEVLEFLTSESRLPVAPSVANVAPSCRTWIGPPATNQAEPAMEMTQDSEMNFHQIATLGKEDTA